jgi:phosphatidylserine/phosphatidylglycerophosphate/cardiolipin synthase-like enzyme
VLPQYPDEDGWFTRDPQILGRIRGVMQVILTRAERVAFYGIENHEGTPVYVHAKVCVLDDHWVTIGSDNFCRRSWTNDSELTAAIVDEAGDEDGLARRLRLALAAEHLDLDDETVTDCVDPAEMFRRYAESADALDAWHRSGRVGARPAGRLRRLPEPKLGIARQAFAAPWYRYLHDPDGRPFRMRLRKRF